MIKIKFKHINLISVIALLLLYKNSYSQNIEYDKCGILDYKHSEELLKSLGSGWGYNYDSLTKDLNRWKKSIYVQVDTIGTSINGRGIWQLKISNFASSKTKKLIYIHARTHPNEVQANYVANQIIEQLISEKDFAVAFRDNAELYIVPMYNPDGVELGKPRENSNNIDLEREWDKNPMQKEAASLKKKFIELMNSQNPIKVALNLHSSLNCKRYFVNHDATGTSQEYASLEKDFITGVRQFYINGIEPWDFNITWKGTTPTLFPESWWWFNFNKNVIALTYEDMNCDQNGNYDSTAFALIGGLGKFLNIPRTLEAKQDKIYINYLSQNSPNPSQKRASIQFSLGKNSEIELALFNLLGEKIKIISQGYYNSGIYESELYTEDLPKGNYIYRLKTNDFFDSKIITIN